MPWCWLFEDKIIRIASDPKNMHPLALWICGGYTNCTNKDQPQTRRSQYTLYIQHQQKQSKSGIRLNWIKILLLPETKSIPDSTKMVRVTILLISNNLNLMCALATTLYTIYIHYQKNSISSQKYHKNHHQIDHKNISYFTENKKFSAYKYIDLHKIYLNKQETVLDSFNLFMYLYNIIYFVYKLH